MTVEHKESLLICPDCSTDEFTQPLSQWGLCVRCEKRFPSLAVKPVRDNTFKPPYDDMNTKDRTVMRMALRQYIMDSPCRGFRFGVISGCEFGIVDRDSMDFLGLHFTVEYVGADGGGTDQHIPTEDSLRILKKFGRAEALNGKYCWVFSEGSGMSVQRFVCLATEVYGDEF